MKRSKKAFFLQMKRSQLLLCTISKRKLWVINQFPKDNKKLHHLMKLDHQRVCSILTKQGKKLKIVTVLENKMLNILEQSFKQKPKEIRLLNSPLSDKKKTKNPVNT